MRIVFAVAIIALIVPLSCRKTNGPGEQNVEQPDMESRFFNLLPNADPMVQKIANDLKKKEHIKPFIRNWIKNNGYPLWDKAVIFPGSATGRSQTNADSIVMIPFNIPGTNAVRSVLNSRITDTIDYRFLEQHKYWQAGFSGNSSSNANSFMSLIMYADNLVYNHEHFWFRDSRLFKANFSSSDSGKYQSVQFKPGNTSRTGGIVYQICYDVTAPRDGQLVGCNPGDPCNPYVTTTHCQDLFVWFKQEQTQYLNPFGATYWSSNSSTGGGGSSGGAGLGDAQLDPNGNPLQYLLFPLLIPTSITDSLTNPCLVEARNKLTNDKLTNFITRLYYNTFSYGADIRFVEDPSITYPNGDRTAALSEYIPSATGPRLFRIKMNPDFFRPTTPMVLPSTSKEFAASAILHEIVHGLIELNAEQGDVMALDSPHKAMFYRWIDVMAETLQEVYPSIPLADAKALSLIGIDDVLGSHYFFGMLTSYNTYMNSIAIEKYQISIPDAYAISREYQLGIRGTICF